MIRSLYNESPYSVVRENFNSGLATKRLCWLNMQIEYLGLLYSVLNLQAMLCINPYWQLMLTTTDVIL